MGQNDQNHNNKKLRALRKFKTIQALVARLRHRVVVLSVLCAALFAGLFILGLNVAGEIYRYQDTFDGVRLPEVDAIVCLAGGRGRIDVAADIWQRYYEAAQYQDPAGRSVPLLYFSGMGPQADWGVLKSQIRRGILEHLTRDQVVIENESLNTIANAQWFATYAMEHQWRRILLITSSYHMRRSRLIFQYYLNNAHLPIEIETYSVFQEPFTSEEWASGPNGLRVTFLEYFKWLYYQYVLKYG